MERKKSKSSLSKLFKWAKPHLVLLIMIMIITIVVPVTYSYVPQFIKYVFDYVLEPNPDTSNTLPQFLINFFSSFEGLESVLAVGVVLVIYQLIRGALMFLNGTLKGMFAEGIAYDMRTKLYNHIQNLSYSYHSSVDTGDLIQRCTSDIDTIKSFISTQLPEILYIFASFVAGALQMANININIMFITLCVLPITVSTSFIYFRYVKKKFEEVEEYESDMTIALQESVNGVRVVKAFAREKYEIDKFNKKSKKFKTESFKLNHAMAMYWGFSDGMTLLQYAATIGYCIYLAKTGLSTGDIVVCIEYIAMLVYPIRSLGRIIGDFGKATVAAGRVDEILAKPDEYQNNGTLKPVITGNIKFDHVSFKFDDTDKHLLDDVSFEIKSGETIAIVGKTGSGKSTIVNMLVRMLDYDKGSITIDGVELKDIEKHYVRENIGIILQDPFLYAKTIYENISIATPNSNEDSIYQAAKTAAIHKDILSFDKGYNTLVGEKGATLSGGQKQRIAIARMLVLNKPIIIFDDSLSALDTKTDLQIRNALKQRDEKMTSIIITHRITTAKEADKIIVLENGKVSEIGTHEELAHKPGLYKSLWDIQGALESQFLKMVDKEVNE